MTQRLLPAFLLLPVLFLSACSGDPAVPDALPDIVDPPAGFVTIPPGTFRMGSPETELGHTEVEHPHVVTISRPFFMKAHEITNEEYRQLAQWALDEGLIHITGTDIKVLRDVSGSEKFFLSLTASGSELDFDAAGDSLVLYDVGFGINPDHPIKYTTWWGAAAYCNWLSVREGLEPAYDQTTWEIDLATAEGYRLPTEAEWEYAARAGAKTSFSGSEIEFAGCDPDSLEYEGWYCYNAEWTHPVGLLAPNAFGLYDMHGNVWEMCNDWYGDDYYKASPEADPTGPTEGPWLKCSRGGSWTWGARYARSAQRGAHFLGMVSEQEGFRPVRTIFPR